MDQQRRSSLWLVALGAAISLGCGTLLFGGCVVLSYIGRGAAIAPKQPAAMTADEFGFTAQDREILARQYFQQLEEVFSKADPRSFRQKMRDESPQFAGEPNPLIDRFDAQYRAEALLGPRTADQTSRNKRLLFGTWTYDDFWCVPFAKNQVAYVQFAKILQVVDPSTALVIVEDNRGSERKRYTLLARGWSTQGKADGDYLFAEAPSICLGPSSYMSVVGANRTVMSIGFFDPIEWAPAASR